MINHITKYITLSEQEIATVSSYIKTITLPNKGFLLQKGVVCNSIYFVKRGCLRMFIYNNKGVEQITEFALDSWWMADFFSFADKTSSDYYIQAVENCEIQYFDVDSYEAMLRDVPQMERYFRIIMQRNITKAQRRLRLLYELSKEDLYIHFATSFPEFIKRVPQYMVASYLNLTPEYVSEIRKKTP